jgi:peptidyl-prolyl cis-trans isomerase B (cyclophilin B)
MKSLRTPWLVFAVASLALAGCTKPTDVTKEESKMDPKNEVAVLDTTYGKMVIEFFEKDAPKTAANFKKLAREGFYEGTAFHRIIKGFMIQGGDPLSKDPNNPAVGTGSPGYRIKAEFNANKHVFGVLSMARSQDPDSAGSQFFICLGDAGFLDGQYTAFGKLIAGDDVLKKIGDVPTQAGRSGEKSEPTERVQVRKVTITSRDEALKTP